MYRGFTVSIEITVPLGREVSLHEEYMHLYSIFQIRQRKIVQEVQDTHTSVNSNSSSKVLETNGVEKINSQ